MVHNKWLATRLGLTLDCHDGVGGMLREESTEFRSVAASCRTRAGRPKVTNKLASKQLAWIYTQNKPNERALEDIPGNLDYGNRGRMCVFWFALCKANNAPDRTITMGRVVAILCEAMSFGILWV